MTDSGIECRTNVPCSLEKGIYFVLFMRSWRREVRGPKLLAKPITVCIPVCACVFVCVWRGSQFLTLIVKFWGEMKVQRRTFMTFVQLCAHFSSCKSNLSVACEEKFGAL